MEIFLDPTIWMGLLTLILLEIVLGIDNLVFIAILADKLPEKQRDKARMIGLSLALLMRLVLLACISWMVTLTDPLFHVLDHAFSGRDLILLFGGLFLLFKATSEIHERLEGHGDGHSGSVRRANFWAVVAQIIVLDAVFSLDAVITAVGMSDHLPVMMTAVIIAMGLMMVASKPLTKFVSGHPTIIMLCLGFLLLVGFSLVADGLGFHVPKGYLYAAIGFSILIEAFNQTSTINRRKKALGGGDLRQKTADTVLRILSGKSNSVSGMADDVNALMHQSTRQGEIFSPAERDMIHGVLQLTERPIRTIMTPRHELVWVDLNDPKESIFNDIRSSSHSALLVSRGQLDEIVGVLRKADLVAIMEPGKTPDIESILRKPLVVHENLSVLKTLEMFKQSPVHMAAIIDEYGSLEGIVTLADIVETIAGDIPDHEDDNIPEMKQQDDDNFIMDGMVSIYDVKQKLELEDLPEGDFSTLAGFILYNLGHMPRKDEMVKWPGWEFTVLQMDKNRIDKVQVRRISDEDDKEPPEAAEA
jgi:CBS domain containing-hemolysin-like protein